MAVKLKILLVTLSTLIIAGCSLSDETLQNAKQTELKIARAAKQNTQKHKMYNTFISSAEYPQYIRYNKRENWPQCLSDADGLVEKAKAIFNGEAKPLIEKNDDDDETRLADILTNISNILAKARKQGKYPFKRIELVKNTKSKLNSVILKAQKEQKETNTTSNKLTELCRTYQNKYPAKKSDIGSKMTVGTTMNDASSKALKAIYAEVVKGTAADYLSIADNATLISKNYAKISSHYAFVNIKMNELDQSYSKVLIDMRIEYWVTPGRTSWDESSDSDTDYDYTYDPRQVSLTTFEYFDKLPDDTTLITDGWFDDYSICDGIDAKKVGELKIDYTEEWPDTSHDSAEFYVADTYEKFFHKYTEISNGVKTETDWIEVDAATYERNEDNLGMEILSKPIGFYEEDTIKQASPAGMSYVGNSHYGRWVRHSNGPTFWQFYGRYAMMKTLLGNDRYNYDEWNNWRNNYRNRKPYYGPKDEDDRYGTYSSGTYARYSGSTAIRNGYIHVQPASIRTAGPHTRGGGPGGGGK